MILMRKLKQTIVILIALILAIIGITSLTKSSYAYVPDGLLSQNEVSSAYQLLEELLIEQGTLKYMYSDYLNEHQHQIKINLGTHTGVLDNSDGIDVDLNKPTKDIGLDDKAVYHVDVTEAGYYQLNLEYFIATSTLNDIIVSVLINGESYYNEMQSIIIPVLWQDETKDFATDRYGDQVLSNQVLIPGWKQSSLYGSTYTTIDPLLFYFNEGINEVEVKNVTSTSVKVADLKIEPAQFSPLYEDYIKSYTSSDVSGLINIEAVNYVSKNSSYIQSYAFNNPSVKPYDPVYKKLNVIDGTTWKRPGQAIDYTFEVEKSGLYQLAFHYINDKTDFDVVRSIAIDGIIPFEEFKAYQIPPTKSQTLTIHKVANQDEPYLVYLEAGTHKLTLKAESEPFQESLQRIQRLIDHINAFSLEIRKITGKTVDKDRTWRFSQYIPETPLYLEAYQTLIKGIISDLSMYAPNAHASSMLSNLQKALARLQNIASDYERLPFYLDDLIGGSGSITQYLGNSLTEITEQPLYLDAFYIYQDAKLPRENANFFSRTISSFKTFLSSFTSSKYRMTKDDSVLDVWVNRPITYVDMMQKMADQTFTKETGVKVKISVMPDANKLVMSSAADQQPDVALGLLSYMPYDLAIRNAAYDLSQFSDYWEFASQFSPGAFIPYILNEKVYALPETLDFNVLMYRSDIFDALNFMVPDTWDEVIQILPELQQYGMDFYHPISGGGSTKYFYQTSGFIMQYGGSLYSEDGTRAAIDSKESIQGLTFLNQLFTNYSLPEQVQSFYNAFRYSTVPIGIGDFNSYLLIKNAAPEITGQWKIAPYPSITPDSGETNRYYIANGTASLVLNGTKKPNESWAFLKWWLCEETQTNFAFNLQSTYGPMYAWLSGNINAVANSPLPEADKQIILEQVRWLVDVPRTPGQYMLERSLSNIWTSVVFDGDSTGIAVDKYTILIDREIRKKMIEFGFIDNDGTVIKTYSIPTIEWIKQQMAESTGDA